jgi:hypothetical protein
MSRRLAGVALTGVAGGYAVSVVILSYLNAGELRAAATSLSLPSPAARFVLGELALASSAALFAAVLIGRRVRRPQTATAEKGADREWLRQIDRRLSRG